MTTESGTDQKPEAETSSSGGPEGLQVAVEEREAWKRRLTITVPADRVARVRSRQLKKLAGSLDLKGFRKGKVPRKIVEERYGPVVDQRTVNALVEDAFRRALDEKDLRAVGDPEFGRVDYEAGDSLTFQVDVEILPEVRLERIGGFRIQRPEVEVGAGDVEEVVTRLREEQAAWEPVERLPAEGDRVSVRISRVGPDGERAEPRPYRFELGEGYAIPGVEDAIRTLSPGAGGEFDVRFPEDFDDEELAGSSRRLHIELVDVKRKRLPELNDEFAAEVGDFDSLEALREAVREDLVRHREEEAREEVRDRLVDSIMEANPFEVPPSMVDDYLDRVIEVPDDADPEEVRNARRSLRPSAERQIKRHLILDRVIESEGFEATDEDVDRRLRELAEGRDADPRELRRRLARGKGLDSLRRQIAVEKAFEHLESRSRIE